MREVRESMSNGSWVARIAGLSDRKGYAEQHWEGSFEDYLELVRKNPKVTRTAFQRVYDMILSHGKTEYLDNKKKLVRYNFFSDPDFGGRDAIFGLDIPLMKLVNVFKSAAQQLRHREARHPPARAGGLLEVAPSPASSRRGSRRTRKTPDGALYTFAWDIERTNPEGQRRREVMPCPMNEEPLHLIPQEWRASRRTPSSRPRRAASPSPTRGDLCPACRFVYKELMTEYSGDWQKVVSHVRVQSARPLREGPGRHRHLPAQGREEPGLHRAHRRHQLPEDRRVRLATPTRAPSTSTASSTSPTAASSSSSRS